MKICYAYTMKSESINLSGIIVISKMATRSEIRNELRVKNGVGNGELFSMNLTIMN